MPGISFTIGHDDHGISDVQMGLIKKAIEDAIWNNYGEGGSLDGVQLTEVNIGSLSGGDSVVQCALRGPACGDDPIPENVVVYEQRGDRPWDDRLCPMSAIAWDSIQVVWLVTGSHEVLIITAYGGPLAPQNPNDPNCADPEFSKSFWSEHALCVDSTQNETLAALKAAAKLGYDDGFQAGMNLHRDW